jgi:gamma-glutamylcyclotransferase (GGCT)/AIG2-like uncharacterized protein YtfP
MADDARPPSALFVYGTLKRGEINHALISPFARSIEPATIRGRLYDVGGFPALVDGDEIVHGELVWVEAETMASLMAILDRLENYQAAAPQSSMYIRQIVKVCCRGVPQTAYTYLYNPNHPALLPLHALRAIDDGVWRGVADDSAPPGVAGLDAYREYVRSFSMKD